MKNIQVIFLAGGLGKRMAPLKVCKSLIHFAGKPIIRYVFDDLKSAGIKDFKIVCNPQHIEDIKKEFKTEKVKVKFYVQKEPKGMADAVLSINDLGTKPMIVVNADDLLNRQGLADFVKLCSKNKSKIVLSGIYKKDYFPGGYFKLTGNKITGLVEKPGKTSQPSNFVNLVLDYFRNPKIFLSYLRKAKSQKDDLYEVAINNMLKDNITAEIFKYDGYWQSLKYPWHILQMMEVIFKNRIKRKIADNCQIHKSAIIDGPVVIEPGVKIFENAVIKGPSYIGKGSIVGTNALVRDSNIAENCVVGYNSEIARSWVGKDCWFHNNYIGDSVLQEDVSFGSGAVTANLRLDSGEAFIKEKAGKIATGKNKLGAIVGKAVRVGINSSLMPGVLIGQNSFVGSGIVLDKNIEKNKFCWIKKNSFYVKDKR